MTLAGLLKQSPSFKVWKADAKARLIDMTTYPQLSGVSNRREQVDVSVLKGNDGKSSVVQIRVTPSTAPEQFTMVDFFLRKKGIIESRADSIARMIFADLDAKIGK